MTGHSNVAERTGATAALRVPAPAKLNLYLNVIGRRPDGYHLLDSLVAFAGIGDEVAVAPDSTIRLTLAGPFASALGAVEDNIVLRAARALSERTGTRPGAAITLTKRLPVAAGLGGGSADAAATLVALARLWRLRYPDSALDTMALQLGADVPVCLSGRAARVSGIGETLAPAPPLPAAHLVLANPGIRLSTPEVYAALDARPAPVAARLAGGRELPPARTAVELARLVAERGNDLERAAQGMVDEIAEVLELLVAQPGSLVTRMSGSGPTCFAVFAGPAEAAEAAARVALLRPGWWVVAAPLLGRIERG